jgi:hypothetical protein
VAPPRAFEPSLRIGVRAVLSQKGVRRAPPRELILDGLKHRLLAPEVVEQFVAAAHLEDPAPGYESARSR